MRTEPRPFPFIYIPKKSQAESPQTDSNCGPCSLTERRDHRYERQSLTHVPETSLFPGPIDTRLIVHPHRMVHSQSTLIHEYPWVSHIIQPEQIDDVESGPLRAPRIEVSNVHVEEFVYRSVLSQRRLWTSEADTVVVAVPRLRLPWRL